MRMSRDNLSLGLQGLGSWWGLFPRTWDGKVAHQPCSTDPEPLGVAQDPLCAGSPWALGLVLPSLCTEFSISRFLSRGQGQPALLTASQLRVQPCLSSMALSGVRGGILPRGCLCKVLKKE